MSDKLTSLTDGLVYTLSQQSARAQGSNPTEPVYTLSVEDLYRGIPVEFRDLKLSDGLKAVLKSKPASVAILGPPGTGKTRMLWALKYFVRHKMLSESIGKPIAKHWYMEGEYERRCETSEQAVDRIILNADRVTIEDEAGGIRAHRYDRAWLQILIDYPHFLCVDDIGCIEPTEWVCEAIYHLSNQRRANGLTTIWTSNLTSKQFRDMFGGAIASRILGGVVIEVDGEDWRLK